MTDPVVSLHAQALARIEEEIKVAEDFIEAEPSPIRCANASISLSLYRALKVAIEHHAPEIRYVTCEDGGSFDSEEEALDNWDTENDGEPNITTFVICSGCAEINKSAMEDADEWTFLPEVYFPCSRLQAIAKELNLNGK